MNMSSLLLVLPLDTFGFYSISAPIRGILFVWISQQILFAISIYIYIYTDLALGSLNVVEFETKINLEAFKKETHNLVSGSWILGVLTARLLRLVCKVLGNTEGKIILSTCLGSSMYPGYLSECVNTDGQKLNL